MIKHSQYFTEEHFAHSIVALIKHEIPITKILDLGIGNGALSYAALNRWPNAMIEAVDIDLKICESYSTDKTNSFRVVHGDVLQEGTNHLETDTYDLALCNPPYGRVRMAEDYSNLFHSANVSGFSEIKQLSADVVFTAKNLLYLKEKGILAIILPDGLLTRIDFLPFRKALLDNYGIAKIIQLPERAFSKTEARTHVMIVSKGMPTNKKVPVSLMSERGHICDTISVDRNRLYERMDYSFLKWNGGRNMKEIKKLDKSAFIVKRGSYSYKELRSMDVSFLHSNMFQNGSKLQLDSIYNINLANKVMAVEGDFVMCRVGKRCVGKIAYIEKGNIILSDCLYKITVPSKYISYFKTILLGIGFQDWVRHVAHGVCSKVISKTELEEFLCSSVINV